MSDPPAVVEQLSGEQHQKLIDSARSRLDSLRGCPLCGREMTLQAVPPTVYCFGGCPRDKLLPEIRRLARLLHGEALRPERDALESFLSWYERNMIPRGLPRPALPQRIPLADRVLEIKRVDRLPTQFPTLNAILKGGIPTRSPFFVGGMPGGGKTTFVVNLALGCAARGVPVSILAVDEDWQDIVTRIGQAEGIDRLKIQEAAPATLAEVSEMLAMRYPTLDVVDGDEPHACLETVAAELVARAGETPALLLVDSLQTVRVGLVDADAEPRARVTGAVQAVKNAARSANLAIVATSEVARGAYASKDPSQRTASIAAFKESSAAEYGAKIALVMRTVPNHPGLREVEVVKNRFGDTPTFRLALDERLALFTETEEIDLSSGRPATEIQLEADKQRAREILRGRPGLTGTALIAAMGVAKARARSAIDDLADDLEIENRGSGGRKGGRPKWFLINPPEPAQNPPGGLPNHEPAYPPRTISTGGFAGRVSKGPRNGKGAAPGPGGFGDVLPFPDRVPGEDDGDEDGGGAR